MLVENSWASIEAALLPIVQTDEGAVEVASAFYDVAWVRDELAARTYSQAFDWIYERGGSGGDVFVLTWRNAGEMVARLRDRGESYMDWCVEASSGVVSDRVRETMAALGLRPVL